MPWFCCRYFSACSYKIEFSAFPTKLGSLAFFSIRSRATISSATLLLFPALTSVSLALKAPHLAVSTVFPVVLAIPKEYPPRCRKNTGKRLSGRHGGDYARLHPGLEGLVKGGAGGELPDHRTAQPDHAGIERYCRAAGLTERRADRCAARCDRQRHGGTPRQ